MYKFFVVLSFFLCTLYSLNAQELKCAITVNSDQVRVSNKQVFVTLEKALSEFINNRKWTDTTFKNEEKIDCGMTLIITDYNNTSFSGTLQINAVRPVFGTSYKSPIFNFKDTAISFNYVEFEPLIFNETTFETNLVSLFSYYIYMILAIDADTFAYKGGEGYYKKALDIANLAQQGGSLGWEVKRNVLNRYSLVDQILSPAHKEYRQIMYAYHREGLDSFSEDIKARKELLLENLLLFNNLYNRSTTSFLFRLFFDAKSDEVVELFSEGPKVRIFTLKRMLNRVSAQNNMKWEKIQ